MPRTETESAETDAPVAGVLAVLTSAARIPQWAPAFADEVSGDSRSGWLVTKDGQVFTLRVAAVPAAGTVDYLRELAPGAKAAPTCGSFAARRRQRDLYLPVRVPIRPPPRPCWPANWPRWRRWPRQAEPGDVVRERWPRMSCSATRWLRSIRGARRRTSGCCGATSRCCGSPRGSCSCRCPYPPTWPRAHWSGPLGPLGCAGGGQKASGCARQGSSAPRGWPRSVPRRTPGGFRCVTLIVRSPGVRTAPGGVSQGGNGSPTEAAGLPWSGWWDG